ncbi:MAG: BON domain-containing protein [Planctomycetes bacterium]|nr:BON domain-containing protein [Planctomycetota bacterium]
MNQKGLYRIAFMTAVAAVLTLSTPLCASETDDQIEASFKKTYVYKTYLKDDSIEAEAKNGLVTLTGAVSEESHKTLAQDTAASLPGVTRVDNQLTTKAEVASDNADTWIGRKIKLALLFHRHVSGFQTEVSVKNGIVTLKGEASSATQKGLTAQYAADIDGVKSVNNEMTIKAKAKADTDKQTLGEKVDDASITAQVKMALLIHRSTSAFSTKVSTQDGKVTLTGVAKNAAEKSLVTKLISDIHGVKSVKNEMTIKKPETK